MILRLAIIILTLVAPQLCSSAMSAPIVFEHWGESGGWLGTTRFNGAFKITAIGDTNDRQFGRDYAPYDPPRLIWIEHSAATIQIQSLGEFNLTSATRTFIRADVGSVGFARAGATGSDLFDGPFGHSSLVGWTMDRSMPEVTGRGISTQWDLWPTIMTAGGQLQLDMNNDIVASFRATVVPEPAYCSLIEVAAASAAFLIRRRTR